MGRHRWAVYCAVAALSAVGLGCLVALLMLEPARIQSGANGMLVPLELQISPAATGPNPDSARLAPPAEEFTYGRGGPAATRRVWPRSI